MKQSKMVIALITVTTITLASCASIKGSVYKQQSGDYKATYSAKTEREAVKAVHSDAKLTCKNDGDKTPTIIDEKIDSLTEDTEKTGEGFAAVAGSAVSAVDKFFSSENVRATIVFNCS